MSVRELLWEGLSGPWGVTQSLGQWATARHCPGRRRGPPVAAGPGVLGWFPQNGQGTRAGGSDLLWVGCAQRPRLPPRQKLALLLP